MLLVIVADIIVFVFDWFYPRLQRRETHLYTFGELSQLSSQLHCGNLLATQRAFPSMLGPSPDQLVVAPEFLAAYSVLAVAFDCISLAGLRRIAEIQL